MRSMKPARGLPLEGVLLAFLLAVTLATAGPAAYILHAGGHRAVGDVSSRLRNEITLRITEHVKNFLDLPHLINRLNAGDIARGVPDADDPASLSLHFWKQVDVFKSVSSIYFGNDRGGLVDSGRESPDDARYVILTDGFAAGTFRKYAVDRNGLLEQVISRVTGFDARTRSWYRNAVMKGDFVWSDIYVLFTGQDMAIAASSPVYDERRRLKGVVAVDLFLSHLSRFLGDLDIASTGVAFIMERSGLMVASSSHEKPFSTLPDTGAQRRVNVLDSSVPAVRKAAESLYSHFGGFGDIETMQHLTFRVDGRKHCLQITPLRDAAGIDWLVAVVSPEAVFFAGIDTDYRLALALIVGILIVAVLACIGIARRIARPIRKLNEAAGALARGERPEGFEADARIAEFGGLSRSLDEISRRLRRSEEELNSGVERCEQLETALRESRERCRMLSARGAPDGRSWNDDDDECDPQAGGDGNRP